MESIKAVPLGAASSRLNRRQLILSLEEQLGESMAGSQSRQADQAMGTAENLATVRSVPALVEDPQPGESQLYDLASLESQERADME